MAVAPINEVRKVINYAASVIPANKIFMGMPLYGYDWTLPYIPGGEFAEAILYWKSQEKGRRGIIIIWCDFLIVIYCNYE